MTAWVISQDFALEYVALYENRKGILKRSSQPTFRIAHLLLCTVLPFDEYLINIFQIPVLVFQSMELK